MYEPLALLELSAGRRRSVDADLFLPFELVLI